jgi:GT2 family glycosyltransferase
MTAIVPTDTVTIVIPTCERWDLLRSTLAGALAQRDVDIEVLIVNDGYSSPPADLVASGETRVRVIEPSGHGGVGRARNAGIAAAEGEWIALLDDDDLWAPEKLASQLRACSESEGGWAYGAGIYVDESLVPFEYLPAPAAENLAESLFRYQLIPGVASNVLVRADLLHDLGGFDEQLHQLSDWDLVLRLALAAPATCVQEVLMAYVQHAASMLVTSPEPVFGEYDLFLAKHRAEARVWGCKPDSEAFSFWAVNRLEKAGERRRAVRESLFAGLHYRHLSLLRNAARLAVGLPASAASSRQSGASLPPTPQWLAGYSTPALA